MTVQGVTIAVCPRYHHAIELIGRRWTGAILLALSGGAERFHILLDAVPGLSDRMLSERLKELETEGIVRRTVLPTTPVTITYQLTDKGKALQGVMDAIGAWAEEWVILPDHAEAASPCQGVAARECDAKLSAD